MDTVVIGPGESLTTIAGTIVNEGKHWIVLPADWLSHPGSLIDLAASAQEGAITVTRRAGDGPPNPDAVEEMGT